MEIHTHTLQYRNHTHPDKYAYVEIPGDKTGPDDVFIQSNSKQHY